MLVLTAWSPPNQIPPAVRDAVAPVIEAMDRVALQDGALPHAASDRERLVRLGRLDQAPREELDQVDVAQLTRAEAKLAWDLIAQRMAAQDKADLAAVMKMLPAHGWFSYSQYGRQAADAAFHIVQHGDLATQKKVLPVLEAFAERGEADPQSFAKMVDRVALREGRLQRYGTQYHCVDGHLAPFPLEDPTGFDARRKVLGLTSDWKAESAAIGRKTCFR